MESFDVRGHKYIIPAILEHLKKGDFIHPILLLSCKMANYPMDNNAKTLPYIVLSTLTLLIGWIHMIIEKQIKNNGRSSEPGWSTPSG